eukprot:scaffold1298_cov382-Prasinococcus_capsulatus_cf.AAC.8
MNDAPRPIDASLARSRDGSVHGSIASPGSSRVRRDTLAQELARGRAQPHLGCVGATVVVAPAPRSRGTAALTLRGVWESVAVRQLRRGKDLFRDAAAGAAPSRAVTRLGGRNTMQEAVQQAVVGQLAKVAEIVEDQVDAELHRLENLDEDDIEAIRQRRLAAMKKQRQKAEEWRVCWAGCRTQPSRASMAEAACRAANVQAAGHGTYRTLVNEPLDKEFFTEAKSERFVCHFYRENWPCKVMDKHLGELAPQHIETKFVKIHAEKCPYVTEKLGIQVLPTLALCKNGKVVDYIVGFNELGNVDDFPTERLRLALAARQVHLHGGRGWPNPLTAPPELTVCSAQMIHYEGNGDGAEAQQRKQKIDVQPKRAVRSGGQRDSDDEDSDFDD